MQTHRLSLSGCPLKSRTQQNKSALQFLPLIIKQAEEVEISRAKVDVRPQQEKSCILERKRRITEGMIE